MDPKGFKDAKAAHARWRRLAAVFFAPPKAPTPFETEAFVSRVMARVKAEAAPAAWWMARWLVPALSVGLATALLLVDLTGPEPSLPLDAQLLAGSDSALSQVASNSALLLPEAP
jgi:hypothetical protein